MNQVINGIMGLCVADALGVPVEFIRREALERDPVVDMRSGGTHNQPAGTWSDDTSMTLCLADSLINSLDYIDIMEKFIKWYQEGQYTPHGVVFDMGITTGNALNRYLEGAPPLKCGGSGERDNGNGSLMRILPLLFYLHSLYGNGLERPFLENETSDLDDIFEMIHNVSALTHAHKRSQMACGIYIIIASQVVLDKSGIPPVEVGLRKAINYYENNKDYNFIQELHHFQRLLDPGFAELPGESIRSSGYVVDTLEAALWCFLQTDNYRDCVLKAVNLGEDTDTVAAVAGSLAGLRYGYENIPVEWLAKVVRRDFIEDISHRLNKRRML